MLAGLRFFLIGLLSFSWAQINLLSGNPLLQGATSYTFSVLITHTFTVAGCTPAGFPYRTCTQGTSSSTNFLGGLAETVSNVLNTLSPSPVADINPILPPVTNVVSTLPGQGVLPGSGTTGSLLGGFFPGGTVPVVGGILPGQTSTTGLLGGLLPGVSNHSVVGLLSGQGGTTGGLPVVGGLLSGGTTGELPVVGGLLQGGTAGVLPVVGGLLSSGSTGGLPVVGGLLQGGTTGGLLVVRGLLSGTGVPQEDCPFWKVCWRVGL